MLHNKTVAVVIPCYNEETQIVKLLESMPDFVDRMIVINDCSTDKTAEVVQTYIDTLEKSSITTRPFTRDDIENTGFHKATLTEFEIKEEQKKFLVPSEVYNKDPENERVILINHLKNGKKGAAVATAFSWCRDRKIDCVAIMDGDGQMDPAELEDICSPITKDGVDYTKGNRLIHKSAYLIIPKIRYLGNSALSLMTKIASGYWRISDTQTGYVAMSFKALDSLQIHKLYNDYGIPNDLLVKMNIAYCTIKEIEIKPVYDVGEQSKMKIHKVIPKMSYLLFRLFFYRLWKKYLFRDFHPLFLLYHLGFLFLIVDFIYFIQLLNMFISGITIKFETSISFAVLTVLSIQPIIFAMWMDILDNDKLHK